MAKLEGIIYKAFESYIVLRGFAPIGDLARISYKSQSYQRKSNEKHKKDIIKFLEDGRYKYFADIILSCRANKYGEFWQSIGIDNSVDSDDGQFVNGLKILREKLPYESYRARHANLTINDKRLLRIDGNHRLEAFDERIEWWKTFFDISDVADVKRKKQKIEEIIVPFTIVFSNEEEGDLFEAGIFNNINFKQLLLKQEKNIQNVHKFLKETEELGIAHNLTMKLIDLAEKEHFKGLELLTKQGNDEDVFRTACFKIAKLLMEKKQQLQEKVVNIKAEIEKQKNNQNKPFKADLEKIENFIRNADNLDAIEIAIQSLRAVYSKMNGFLGNLSVLTAFVYYKLLDELKFNSFVDWILRNGINKIPVNDELPTHDANSLIVLFERVYEAKRKEIFISMQFGDPQSEMIYEKVIQTIEKFNCIKGLDIAVTPIRVDQTVKPSAFTIPEEILRAIEDCSLIIADLSSSNINVYHEVGYAMGIAKAKGMEPPVILLYKINTESNKDKKDVDKFIGFNLRDTSQLRFTNYKELTDELTKQLEVYFEI